MTDGPLRIALLTYSTKPRGGVVHTLSLAEALAELGHQVDVWSLARGGDQAFFRPVDERVTIRLVPFPDRENESVGQRILRSIATLRTELRGAAEKYHIVHAQDCISANAVPRCVRTIHHLDTFATPELQQCHERAIKNPYAHICVSAAVAKEVEQQYQIRPTVIPNGIDAARFAAAGASDPPAAAARQGWQARLGSSYVLSVGGIEPRKGTLDLIEAMAQVQRRRPHTPLVIAGGETLFDYRDYRERVLARATELNVQLDLLGTVAHDQLPALMAQCSAFAFPSVKEGFGLAAMEALAAGVPVVMRDLPVLREVFGDTVVFAGDTNSLGVKILQVLGGQSQQMRSAGRQLAARHKWSMAAQRHVEFYRSLAATTRA